MSYPILGRLQAQTALEEAFPRVFGRAPSVLEVAILLAQSEHETGAWHHMCGPSAWNWGGLKGSGDAGSVELMTTEGAGDAAVRVVQKFRAYSSPAAGCADWLDLLKRCYPEALKRAQAGDAHGFVNALVGGSRKYFTGSPVEYSRRVTALAKRWLDEISPQPQGAA